MVTITLDPGNEQRFRELAKAQGRDIQDLVREALEEYLDLQSWEADTDEAWAEASVAMAPEVMTIEEAWPEGDEGNGSIDVGV